MKISETASYFDNLLNIKDFASDPSNNGLQVCFDSDRQCGKIAFAVDAALATIRKAVETGADMLLVHHGLSWGGEPRYWNGMNGKRFGELFKNDLALYAVHLPLDAHAVYGNNAVLCNLMQLENRRMFFPYAGCEIGFIGETAPVTLEELAQRAAVGRGYRIFASDLKAQDDVRKVAVISGGGGMDGLESAIAAGADVLVTGEFDHVMYHIVQENPVHVIALGHYNSEVHGVQSLQQLAANELGLETVFLDVPTGL